MRASAARDHIPVRKERDAEQGRREDVSINGELNINGAARNFAAQRDLPKRRTGRRHGKTRISRVIGRKPNSGRAQLRHANSHLTSERLQHRTANVLDVSLRGVSHSFCCNMNCTEERFQPSHCEMKTSESQTPADCWSAVGNC